MKMRHFLIKKYFIIAIFFGLILASNFFPISSAFIANGVFSYDYHKISIQSFNSGIIEKVFVKNGDEVKRGDKIIEISAVKASSDRNALRFKLLTLILQKQILELESQNVNQIDVNKFLSQIRFLHQNMTRDEVNQFTSLVATSQLLLKNSIDKFLMDLSIFDYKKNILFNNLNNYQNKIGVINNQIAIQQDLVNKNYSDENLLIELQKQQYEVNAQILNIKNEIIILAKQRQIFRFENIINIAKKIIESSIDIKINNEQLRQYEDVLSQHILYSSIDGFVDSLAIHSPGEVIESGKIIANIVPKLPNLIVVAKVRAVDVDNIKINQAVQIFVKNYYEKNIPRFFGNIFEISKDAIFDERLGDYVFEIKISINDNNQPALKKINLSAGMLAEIYINQSSRNIVSYFFAPIIKSINKSFNDKE